MRSDPVQDVLLVSWPVSVERPSPCDELVQEDSVAPHVALGREVSCLDVLRSCITNGPYNLMVDCFEQSDTKTQTNMSRLYLPRLRHD